jgi:hypothetical protein
MFVSYIPGRIGGCRPLTSIHLARHCSSMSKMRAIHLSGFQKEADRHLQARVCALPREI